MFTSDVIEKHGMETARVLCGHKKTKTTERYNHPKFEVHFRKFYKKSKGGDGIDSVTEAEA